MSGKIELNLTEAKEFSLQEEITELNDSGTNDPTPTELENGLEQEGGAVLLADGTIKPRPIKEEMSAEPEVEPEVIV